MNERLSRSLLRLAEHRARRDGIGDAAHYMRLHESNHPAEVQQHVIKELAAARRAKQLNA